MLSAKQRPRQELTGCCLVLQETQQQALELCVDALLAPAPSEYTVPLPFIFGSPEYLQVLCYSKPSQGLCTSLVPMCSQGTLLAGSEQPSEAYNSFYSCESCQPGIGILPSSAGRRPSKVSVRVPESPDPACDCYRYSHVHPLHPRCAQSHTSASHTFWLAVFTCRIQLVALRQHQPCRLTSSQALQNYQPCQKGQDGIHRMHNKISKDSSRPGSTSRLCWTSGTCWKLLCTRMPV